MKTQILKTALLAFVTLNLTSCLFDETSIKSDSSLAGGTGGSIDASLYVKFSDVTTCTGGKVLSYDGSHFSCLSAGVQSQTNITTGGSSYVVTDTQNGVMFAYNDTVDGVISLPAISSLQNGFTVSVVRQSPYKVLIQTNGADTFGNGKNGVEMIESNMSSVTLTLVQGKWAVTNQTEDCVIGQACWGQNHIYVGKLNGHQYFTTPSGCTDSATPTCAGGNDTLLKMWASNSGTANSAYYNGSTYVTTGASNYFDGKAQSAMLANNYDDTESAKFCENMTYAGRSDWYLPAKAELELLYKAKVMTEDYNNWYYYWSSTEGNTNFAWLYAPQYGYMVYDDKTNGSLVRCVRRF